LGCLLLGLRHGAYCVGCYWMLMALLFVGGVMNVLGSRSSRCLFFWISFFDSGDGLRVLPALLFSPQERGCYFLDGVTGL
jgi:hypothetical protein